MNESTYFDGVSMDSIDTFLAQTYTQFGELVERTHEIRGSFRHF